MAIKIEQVLTKSHKADRPEPDPRMFNLSQGCNYTGMGENTFRAWAERIGARREFSPRLVRYDKRVIDAALDELKK